MLLTKLHIPSAGNDIISRTGLWEKLNTGLRRKLILVSAPAGFGKTTLVSDWINHHQIPVSWISLDKGDNDPVELLKYIISGIQNFNKNFGQHILKLAASPNKPAPESIAGLLINEILNIEYDFLLVLDDFHLITTGDIVELVAYLLQHIPDNMHLVIITRADPALPVARLRSQQQLVELRLADLSFSANEISTLFNKKLKLDLSAEDVRSLETRTEGWIAGLQLAALSLRNHRDVSGFIRDLKGDNQYIMDYLMEEVLKSQPEKTREFLLQTSVLNPLSAPLCDFVLSRNDSQIMIENLERNNMFFIPLDTDRHWYRYHHLFSELLRRRLQMQGKVLMTELHNRACNWFEQNNMVDLAIEHALAIKNHDKSIQLIGGIVEEKWRNGQHGLILKYSDLLPDEIIKKNPDFCFYYAWILITAGRIQKAEPFLASAEEITFRKLNYRDSSPDEIQYYKKLSGKIAVARAYLASHTEHNEKIFNYCNTAIENLSEEDPFWFSWAWFSKGIAWFSNGDLAESSVAFRKAFEYGKKSGNIYLISTIAIRMAENEQQLGRYKSAYGKCADLLALMKDQGYSQITKAEWTYAPLYYIIGTTQFMWAETEKAYENLKIACDLCKKGGDITLKAMVLMVYVVILRNRGDLEAEKRIAELDDIMNGNNLPPFIFSYYIGWKIHLFLEKKQPGKAREIASEYGLDTGKEITYANEGAYSSYARLLLTEHKLDEAEILIRELFTLAGDGNRIERMIDLKTALAILYNMKGEREKAMIFLTEAMELAAEENLLSFFIFSTEHIDVLLKDIFRASTISSNIPKKFIRNLQTAFERKENLKKIYAESELSSRELDTLKLMADNLINQEIADRLFISLNTVKTHLKNIFLKLEVDNRSKAVAKAKDMGLI